MQIGKLGKNHGIRGNMTVVTVYNTTVAAIGRKTLGYDEKYGIVRKQSQPLRSNVPAATKTQSDA